MFSILVLVVPLGFLDEHDQWSIFVEVLGFPGWHCQNLVIRRVLSGLASPCIHARSFFLNCKLGNVSL